MTRGKKTASTSGNVRAVAAAVAVSGSASKTAATDQQSCRGKGKKIAGLMSAVRSGGPVTRSVTRQNASLAISRLSGCSSEEAGGSSTKSQGGSARTPKALRLQAGAAGANFMAQWTPSTSPSPTLAEASKRRRAYNRKPHPWKRCSPMSEALARLPPLSTNPDDWSPPPQRDTRRLSEYARRLAILPTEDSTTDEEEDDSKQHKGPPAAAANDGEPAGADDGRPARAASPPVAAAASAALPAASARDPHPVALPASAKPQRLSRSTEKRLAILAAAHQGAVRVAAAIKREVKLERAAGGQTMASASAAPPVLPAATAPAAAAPAADRQGPATSTMAAAGVSATPTQSFTAARVPLLKGEAAWPGEGDTSASGTGARRTRTKGPPRHHPGGA